MQHISKRLLWLCCFVRFVFNELSIHKQIWALAEILCSNQFSKYFPIDRVFIMNRTKYFYFMSFFCQAICNGKYVIIIRTSGLQTKH